MRALGVVRPGPVREEAGHPRRTTRREKIVGTGVRAPMTASNWLTSRRRSNPMTVGMKPLTIERPFMAVGTDLARGGPDRLDLEIARVLRRVPRFGPGGWSWEKARDPGCAGRDEGATARAHEVGGCLSSSCARPLGPLIEEVPRSPLPGSGKFSRYREKFLRAPCPAPVPAHPDVGPPGCGREREARYRGRRAREFQAGPRTLRSERPSAVLLGSHDDERSDSQESVRWQQHDTAVGGLPFATCETLRERWRVRTRIERRSGLCAREPVDRFATSPRLPSRGTAVASALLQTPMKMLRTRTGKRHGGQQAYRVLGGMRGLRNARRRLRGLDAGAPEMVAGPAIGNLAGTEIGAPLDAHSAREADPSSGWEPAEGPVQPLEE
jgi:hypothetical protein